MSVQKADVVIVGGGVMGSATAFFLRRRGLSVILLERDQIGQYASGVNAGKGASLVNWPWPTAPGRCGSACRN